jgi:hypothetical protein
MIRLWRCGCKAKTAYSKLCGAKIFPIDLIEKTNFCSLPLVAGQVLSSADCPGKVVQGFVPVPETAPAVASIETFYPCGQRRRESDISVRL